MKGWVQVAYDMDIMIFLYNITRSNYKTYCFRVQIRVVLFDWPLVVWFGGVACRLCLPLHLFLLDAIVGCASARATDSIWAYSDVCGWLPSSCSLHRSLKPLHVVPQPRIVFLHLSLTATSIDDHAHRHLSVRFKTRNYLRVFNHRGIRTKPTTTRRFPYHHLTIAFHS